MRIITSLGWWASARAGLDPDDNEDNDDDPEWLTPVGGDIQSAVLCCVRTGSGVFVSVKEIWIWCVTCLGLVAMLCIIWPVHGSIPKIYVCYSRMQKTLRISIKTWYLLAKGFVDNKIAMNKYCSIYHKKMTLLGYNYQNDFSMKTKRRKEIIIVNGSYNEKSFSRKR